MRQVSPVIAGLACRCPSCGKGKLFKGYIKVCDTCAVCGFDLRAADSGDGPVVFILLIAGGVTTFLALYVELTYVPPLWLHLVLWIPLAGLISAALIRPFKSLLIAAQFHFKAKEARHDGG